jgi:YHYH protein/Fibronectin type III domain
MKRTACSQAAPIFFAALTACLAGCNSGGDSSATVDTATTSAVAGAPTALVATAGDASISLAFTAPASNGGAAITSYAAACIAGGTTKTGTASSSPVVVSGLTNATAYTCSVAAINSVGTGSVSTTVNATPVAASTTTSGSLASGYKLAQWASNVSVTYPTECTMTIISNGQPNHAINAYYLEPTNIDPNYSTQVATTPNSGMPLTIRPYIPLPESKPVTFNTCPTKAAATTATTGGNIGIMISSPALFNATEGQLNGPAALTDNVTYTGLVYKNGVSTGVTATASFIDSCNGHPAPRAVGDTYHYHGLPACVTAQVDAVGGPSHLIGVAADGFPIYGSKDINGNSVTIAQLDACNGITSPTPEFPKGVYHYVLPEGVTSFQSSLRCYSGTVTKSQIASLQSSTICTPPNAVATMEPVSILTAVTKRPFKVSAASANRRI